MRTASRTPRRYPLQMTIAAAFTLLLLVFGGLLIGYSFVDSRRIARLGADAAVERASAAVAANTERLYRPARNIVDLAAHVVGPDELGATSDGAVVDVFREALLRNDDISALYVADAQGRFLLVRRCPPPAEDGRQKAPPERARFTVQRIVRPDTGEPRETETFLDVAGRPIERRPVEWRGFDPRTRGWYREAIATPDPVASDFYVFFTTREVGITLARRTAGGDGVVGADLALADLEGALAEQRITPSTQIVLLDSEGTVIALSESELGLPTSGDRRTEAIDPPLLEDLDTPLYRAVADRLHTIAQGSRLELDVDGRPWMMASAPLPTRTGGDLTLVLLVPENELLADVIRIRNRSLVLSVVLLAAALAVGLALARNLSGSLRSLAAEAEDVRALRLDGPSTVRSNILEVDQLATTMGGMKSSLRQFLAISRGLSAEKSFGRLLEMILDEARRVTSADAGSILLLDENDQLEVAVLRHDAAGDHVGGSSGRSPDADPIPLDEVEGVTVTTGRPVVIDDLRSSSRVTARVRARYERAGLECSSLLSVPLLTPQDDVIGVLELAHTRPRADGPDGFPPELVTYVEALSSNAAVALDNRRLLEAQKALLDSFIHVVAGAIDAKSPYTHGHCQRVPKIARLLAEAAHETDEGAFADFHLSDDEWYELHLASWLHDCGKVTTPEYVVDKSTKLETLSNRIHEIRTRFEVLWRDADIAFLRGVLSTPDDEARLRVQLDRRRTELTHDWEFIARCNLGDEPLSDDDLERIRRIGSQTWTRHFDDRLGLSHLELARRGRSPFDALPATETLLADRPEHVIPREPGSHPFGDNRHGFRMDVPDNLYDLGEITNLSIRRGTLTPEERFKINEHIIQTLRMLGQLPFPKELRRVPEWAGNHHEKLDGTGYPRRLASEQLSVPDRIMAVADVFEALTASDRPYMAPKTLSRAVSIMASMSAAGHLCPDLFELMLREGVHQRYARAHLRPEQLDDVDIETAVVAARRRGA